MILKKELKSENLSIKISTKDKKILTEMKQNNIDVNEMIRTKISEIVEEFKKWKQENN